ncbi:MAG: DUF1848 domain-containing protein [Firmicutes bacterium]|nr:DUF1848 domain-containing protein [Bacillota bacterium]
MIINTGNRTDIPAFFSDWFYQRIREGYALVRSPYAPLRVSRYRLQPDVVDGLVFCTKNPAPMLPRLGELAAFRLFFYVTITPYGKEIEPGVPDKHDVIASVRELAKQIGPERVFWRYDPIFISSAYSAAYHLDAFSEMASMLDGSVSGCVISYIDLYEKTMRNFPEVGPVEKDDRLLLGEGIGRIGRSHGLRLYTCLEGEDMAPFGFDTSGCMTKEVLEKAWDVRLQPPRSAEMARQGCRCLLGGDLGVYNTCSHFCRYCYANYDRESVLANRKLHDPLSPFLIGHGRDEDIITDVKQESWIDDQLSLF